KGQVKPNKLAIEDENDNHTESGKLTRSQKTQLESAFRQATTMKNIINWVLDYNRNTSFITLMSSSHFMPQSLIFVIFTL
ncbi:MAG: hypothetical protein ACFNVI_02140, partial [Lachnoanaerobaculum gingivalis]